MRSYGWDKINKEASEEIEHTLIAYREGFEDGKKAMSADCWHDARKELPDKGCFVLCLDEHGRQAVLFYHVDIAGEHVWKLAYVRGYDYDHTLENIIAWRPLPDPVEELIDARFLSQFRGGSMMKHVSIICCKCGNKAMQQYYEQNNLYYCPECFSNLPKAKSNAMLADRWHDARKELPKKSDSYLVCVLYGLGRNIQISFYNNHWLGLESQRVTAWRPLPDPPDFEEGNIPDKSKHDLSDYEY